MYRTLFKTATTFCFLFLILLTMAACSGDAEPTLTPAPGDGRAALSVSQPSTPLAGVSSQPTPVPAPTVSVKTIGGILADWGFRPDKNGFSFENYSNAKKYQNLTAVEMQRIFGDGVCGSTAGGKCLLSPPAQKLMEQYNRAMAGGHCFGFSVLALRFAQKLANPADFGGKSVAELQIQGNEKLQREIAYSYTFQFFDPVNQKIVQGTPNDVLDKLIAYFKSGTASTESYTLGFFNERGGGGHAVTPYAVEDRGNGTYAVLLYDNNLPKTPREMLFDRTSNSWTYFASTNPALKSARYYGDAKTQSLFLLPTTPGLKQQVCPVCTPQTGKPLAGTQTYNAIFLHGDPRNHGHLLITDDQGRRYGYLPDGTFVREIPGATHTIVLGQGEGRDLWNDAPEPIYYIPTGLRLVTQLDGGAATSTAESGIVAIGPGYYVGIEGINLDPGQVDTLTIGADGTELSYKTAADEAPDVVMGVETAGPDYAFSADDLEMKGGATLSMDLDADTGRLKAGLEDSDAAGTYDFQVTRINTSGEQVFTYTGIQIASGETDYIEYGDWLSGTGYLEIGVDDDGDGIIDDTEKYQTGDPVQADATPDDTDQENQDAVDESDQETPTDDASVDEGTPTDDASVDPEETPTDDEIIDEETPTPDDLSDEGTPTPDDSYSDETPTPDDSYSDETPTPDDYADDATPTPDDSYEEPTPDDSYQEPTPDDPYGQEQVTPDAPIEEPTPEDTF